MSVQASIGAAAYFPAIEREEIGMRGMMIVAGALALAVPGTAAAQEGSFAWLSGAWCTAPEVVPQTCEVWSDEIAGGVAGISRVAKDGKVVSDEKMAIGISRGRLSFIAMPAGATEPTRFPMISRGPTELVFENRDHDYPQRIRYWRDGDALMAEISLADGSKPMRWRYERVKAQ